MMPLRHLWIHFQELRDDENEADVAVVVVVVVTDVLRLEVALRDPRKERSHKCRCSEYE